MSEREWDFSGLVELVRAIAIGLIVALLAWGAAAAA